MVADKRLPGTTGSRWHRPRAGFGDRDAFRTKRAATRLVGRERKIEEGLRWDVELHGAAAAVDDRRRANHLRAGVPGNRDGLARGSTGREYVLDHQHVVVRIETEAATKRQCSILAFRENGTNA